MIRVPDWAFEAAGQETRGMGQDAAAYQPGLYLTPAQVGLVNVSRPVDFILEVMQSSI
jgi:E3 ubiquitin-protein ligase SIS3